jgi:hypothetical protein
MQGLFAQTGLLGLLKSLHATVAIPTQDHFNTRHVGWIVLPQEQGYNLAADNPPQVLITINSATWYGVMPPHVQRYAAVDLIEGRS